MNLKSFYKINNKTEFSVIYILTLSLKLTIIGYLTSLIINTLDPYLPASIQIKEVSFFQGIILSSVICFLSFIFNFILSTINYIIFTKNPYKPLDKEVYKQDVNSDDNDIQEIRDDLNAIDRLYRQNYTSAFEHHKLLDILNKKLTRLEKNSSYHI